MSGKKDLGEMIKLGLILVVYAVASCTVLAIVNNFTKPKIMQNQIEKANVAMKKVFANADEFEQIFDFKQSENKSIKISDVYLAKKDGKVIGGVAQVAGPTYDKGKLIVGVKIDGEISGVEIIELSDSPGFGLKANDPTFILPNGKTFYGQFSGLNAKEPFVSGKNYDAISGATITSDAIINLIKAGSDSLLDYMESKYE